MSDFKISKELDFSKSAVASPQYISVKVTPQGGSTVSVSNTGTAQAIFELPTKPINFSKSYFQATMATDTAGGAGLTIICNLDAFPLLESMNLSTRSGTPICNMSNIQQYLRIMNYRGQSYSEYKTRSEDDSLFYPSNATANLTFDAVASNSTTTAEENLHYTAGTANGILTISNAKCMMSDFKDSIFAVDKNLMFPEICTLTLGFGGVSRQFIKSDSAAISGTLTAYANGVNITAMELHLCIDANKSNELAQAQQIDQKGYTVVVPYPISNKQSFATSSAQNVGITLSSSSGRYLRKVVHSIFRTPTATDGGTIVATALNNSNKVASVTYGGLELTNYHTELNSDRLQQYDLQCGLPCSDFADWKAKNKDTGPIFSRARFYYSWAHIDDWTNGRKGENEHVGIPINGQAKWDFVGTTTTTNTHDHYTFVILGRELLIRKDGVAWI